CLSCQRRHRHQQSAKDPGWHDGIVPSQIMARPFIPWRPFMNRLSRTVASALALILVLVSTSSIVRADRQEGLIVRCARPCAAVVAAVAAAGGTIAHRYDNVDAVAVSVPASRVSELSA